VLQNVLSSTRLEKVKHVRISEVEISIKELYNICGKGENSNTININKWFEKLTLNIIVKMIVDKRYISLEKDKDAQCFRKEAMSGDTAWYKVGPPLLLVIVILTTFSNLARLVNYFKIG